MSIPLQFEFMIILMSFDYSLEDISTLEGAENDELYCSQEISILDERVPEAIRYKDETEYAFLLQIQLQ